MAHITWYFAGYKNQGTKNVFPWPKAAMIQSVWRALLNRWLPKRGQCSLWSSYSWDPGLRGLSSERHIGGVVCSKVNSLQQSADFQLSFQSLTSRVILGSGLLLQKPHSHVFVTDKSPASGPRRVGVHFIQKNSHCENCEVQNSSFQHL